MEFRIYCEDVEGCPIHIVTEGVLNLFADLSDDASKEAHNTSEQETSFPDFIPISSQASADRTKPKSAPAMSLTFPRPCRSNSSRSTTG
jgi:hypothetical protein